MIRSKNVYNNLDLQTGNKYNIEKDSRHRDHGQGQRAPPTSKNVYNKLDLETYNKYNIENDNAIEIMDKDNRCSSGRATGGHTGW